MILNLDVAAAEVAALTCAALRQMLAYDMRQQPTVMPAERRVKVFRNGRNLAVRIPNEREFARVKGLRIENWMA